MRLGNFISANIESILTLWEEFARSLSVGANLSVVELRDHAESVLRACLRDMGETQSEEQRTSKSRGEGGAGGAVSDRLDHASYVHGLSRVGAGFNLNDVVSEYRALRASVLRLWRASLPRPDIHDLDDITRFNESIDQSIAKAVAGYTHRVDQSRRMFLAILSHDLRNPLNCISMSAQYASACSDPELAQPLSQIETSVQAISRLINDLLDFASTGLGAHIPVVMAPTNLTLLCREVMNEFQTANPVRTLHLDSPGDLICSCDGGRMRQVISNLLGNALAHGQENSNIELSLRSEGASISIAVHNLGTISPALLPTIFDPLTRDTSADGYRHRPQGSVGLGLYIAREIVTAHGGTIEVSSSIESGTNFTVRIPCDQPSSGQ